VPSWSAKRQTSGPASEKKKEQAANGEAPAEDGPDGDAISAEFSDFDGFTKEAQKQLDASVEHIDGQIPKATKTLDRMEAINSDVAKKVDDIHTLKQERDTLDLQAKQMVTKVSFFSQQLIAAMKNYDDAVAEPVHGKLKEASETLSQLVEQRNTAQGNLAEIREQVAPKREEQKNEWQTMHDELVLMVERSSLEPSSK